MDSFVPPGWMTRTELVERTGKVTFKDAWLGAMPTTAELLQAYPELRPSRGEALRRARAGLSSSIESILADQLAKRLADYQAEEPKKAEMHDEVVRILREPLCLGSITSGILTSSGSIEELPPHFWQGERAIPAFDTEEAIHGREVQTAIGPVLRGAINGRVLFERKKAEAWLVSREGPSSEVAGPTIDDLAAFLNTVADGTKTESKCRTEAQKHFRVTLPDKSLWRPAWARVPPEKKRPRGRTKER